jgi:hypothetical protein
MNDDEILKYFGELMQKQGEIPTEAMTVLGKLIRLTIEYRDRLRREKQEILTVEETKLATGIYTSVLDTGKLLLSIDPKITGLVKLWLKEVNGISTEKN